MLLLTDPISKSCFDQRGRVPAIVQGQGPGAFLEVKFIPRNDQVTPGEILISSGQGGVFPKGIPVARVVEVTPADVSLFQKVYAEPLLALRYYEELLVLSRRDREGPPHISAGSTPGGNNTSREGTHASTAEDKNISSVSPDADVETSPSASIARRYKR